MGAIADWHYENMMVPDELDELYELETVEHEFDQ